eukprot:2004907-Rhodomonas_salina.1
MTKKDREIAKLIEALEVLRLRSKPTLRIRTVLKVGVGKCWLQRCKMRAYASPFCQLTLEHSCEQGDLDHLRTEFEGEQTEHPSVSSDTPPKSAEDLHLKRVTVEGEPWHARTHLTWQRCLNVTNWARGS